VVVIRHHPHFDCAAVAIGEPAGIDRDDLGLQLWLTALARVRMLGTCRRTARVRTGQYLDTIAGGVHAKVIPGDRRLSFFTAQSVQIPFCRDVIDKGQAREPAVYAGVVGDLDRERFELLDVGTTLGGLVDLVLQNRIRDVIGENLNNVVLIQR
jgi:hypothetical protein